MMKINSSNTTQKDSDHSDKQHVNDTYIEIKGEPQNNLRVNQNNTNLHLQQFTFTSSDKPIHHGHKWCPGLSLLFVESIFVYFGYIIVAIVLWVITIIIIIGFCIVENCHSCDQHTVEFNNNTSNVSLYTNKVLTKRIPYDEFVRLCLKYEEQSYQYCYFWLLIFGFIRCCFYPHRRNLNLTQIICEIGNETYQTATVCAVLKSMEHISGGVYQNKCYRINGSYGCYKNEIDIAHDMVVNVNKYLKVGNSDDAELQPKVNKNNKKYDIGSFCYVDSVDRDRVYHYNAFGDCDNDCDTVYGVIVDLMPGGYTIIDLFEERERFAEEKSVTLITEKNVVKEVQMLLNEYRNNKGKEGQ